MLSCVSWAWVAAAVLIRLDTATTAALILVRAETAVLHAVRVADRLLRLLYLNSRRPSVGHTERTPTGGSLLGRFLAHSAEPTFSLTSVGRSSADPGSVRRTSVTGCVGLSATVTRVRCSLPFLLLLVLRRLRQRSPAPRFPSTLA